MSEGSRRYPNNIEDFRGELRNFFHYLFVVIFTCEKDIFRQRKDTIFLVKEILAAGGIHVVCSILS